MTLSSWSRAEAVADVSPFATFPIVRDTPAIATPAHSPATYFAQRLHRIGPGAPATRFARRVDDTLLRDHDPVDSPTCIILSM